MKRKTVALFLALTMVFTCVLTVLTPASAISAEFPAMPKTLPDGTVYQSSKTWVDWSSLGLNGTNAAVSGEFYQITTAYSQCWSGTGSTLLPEPTAWRGAGGVMFYLDASASGISKTDFTLEFLSDGSRPKSSTATSYVQLNTKPIQGTATAYYYTGSAWQPCYADAASNGGRFTLNATGATSAWVYVPFTSVWYRGGSASTRPATEDTAYGLNFAEFMENFEKARVIRAGFQSSSVGLKFSNLELVYTDPGEVGNNYSVAPLFGTMTQSALEGSAKSVVDGNAVTVSGLTGNSESTSSSRVWLQGVSVSNLGKATGLRFFVDSSALDAGAALQLRLRLMSNVKVASTTTVYKNGSGNLVSGNWSNPQYVCGADNSDAYYYDADGEPVALHVQENVSTVNDGDLFEALPEGYRGYIYIPFDSFWMSGTSFSNKNLMLPFSVSGANYPISQIAICHAVSGGTASDAVTYSDFEVVYAGTALIGASLTLTNNLNVNFHATIEEDATAPAMEFRVGTKISSVSGEKQADGTYRFVCANILPQNIGDRITATLTAKVGNYTVTDTLTYSVRQYCESALANPGASEALKTLLVDLLYYGAAAQSYADYRTDDLVTGNLTEAQKALRSSDLRSAIEAAASVSGTASADVAFVSATLLLDNAVAAKFTFTASSVENLTAEISINGRTGVIAASDFAKNGDNYTVIFRNIGADEYDSGITVILKKGGEQIGKTLTYSVAAYVRSVSSREGNPEKLSEILRSVYAYGTSAKKYAISVAE